MSRDMDIAVPDAPNGAGANASRPPAEAIEAPLRALGDTVRVLSFAVADLMRLVQAYRALEDAAATNGVFREELDEIRRLSAEVDLYGLLDKIPDAADDTVHSADRLREIVRALTR